MSSVLRKKVVNKLLPKSRDLYCELTMSRVFKCFLNDIYATRCSFRIVIRKISNIQNIVF